MIYKQKILVLLHLIALCWLHAQGPGVHSHNDYDQSVPFWKAYSAGVTSIEADVYLKGNELLVAHDKDELRADRTLEGLYLEPLQTVIALGLEPRSIQLLIDIKSEAYQTLEVLVKLLDNYPEITGSEQTSFVISGNRPALEDYVKYPSHIYFDYQRLDSVADSLVLDKIAMISLNFTNYSGWNGKGRLTREDLNKVVSIIDKAHALGKPFRFWATPDSKSAWKALSDLGVDLINTDKPFECVEYFSSLPKRVYVNPALSDIYIPEFATDGSMEKAQNIILFIGDGNGLTQISAAALVNGGDLTLTQLKKIGLLKTRSSDDFTTDSAAAATAMATGETVPNRSIGVDRDGKPVANLTELLAGRKYVTGIITSDEITGATPASFYAHQKDRDMTKAITKDLAASPLSFFISAGPASFGEESLFASFEYLETMQELEKNTSGRFAHFFQNDITPAPLSTAVKYVLTNLQKRKNPFFLMVEGAKIDTYGHANKIDRLLEESLAFDRAIAEAVRFADKEKNTLVVITADHETGGLSIPQGNTATNTLEADFTSDDHTGAFVPIFAYGPRSFMFQGVYENRLVFDKILEVLGVSKVK